MRDLTNDVKTALAASSIKTAILVELGFSSQINIWTGYTYLTHNSITYEPSAKIIQIDGIGERSDISSVSSTITLTGVNPELNYKLLTENWQNREAVVRLALFDTNDAVIADPIILSRGRMDNAVFSANGDGCTVSFTIESQLVDLETARGSR